MTGTENLSMVAEMGADQPISAKTILTGVSAAELPNVGNLRE